jgi:hypothetical protein
MMPRTLKPPILNIAQFMGLRVTCFCQIVDLAQNKVKTLAKI